MHDIIIAGFAVGSIAFGLICALLGKGEDDGGRGIE